MNKQIEKIAKALIEKIYENGGHWVKIKMKPNGDILYIQRRNFQSFEDLEKEKFIVYKNDNKDFMDFVSVEEIATYISLNYTNK